MMMDIDELSTLCRVCMGPGYLPPTTHSKEKLLGSQNSSLLTKSLGSLFICFTSLNVREEAKEFPKHLCLKCLTKLRDYKDFRDEAMRTTKRLEEILNEKNSGFVNDDSCAEPERFVHETLVKCELTYEDDIKTERDEIIIDSNDNDNSYCNDNAASENDDNTLLLPELANMPLIKTEPMETETTFPFFENNLEESNVNKSKSDDNEYLHSNKGNDNNDSDKRGILEPNKNLSLSLSEEERTQMEERLSLWLGGDDAQPEESTPFDGDDDTDPDYEPLLDNAASDAETDIAIETESLYDDDEDLDDFYEGAAAVPEVFEAVDMREEPHSSSSTTSYKSKDGKHWSSAPPVTGRPRAHNCVTVGREGPAPGSTRNPISIFKYFITPEIVSIIVRETNRKAREICRQWSEQHPEQTPRSWTKPVTENEIYAFIGLTLFAGIFGSNNQPSPELWGHNGNPIYRATMSACRYKHILSYIRFDNSSTRSARLLQSKSAAIDDIWNMLMINLERRYVPGAQITVDEQLFPYRGRTRFTQYIPSKPAKYGIKIWWVCDSNSNYPLKGIIYVGKEAGEARAVNLGENVVLKLVEKYSGSGRTIYADNFFSSYDLATILMTKRLAYVGTIRKNKACIPKEMLDPKREVLSTLFGYHNNNIALCSYVPKKKKVVVLISTEHYNSAIDSSKPAKKPLQILDYNMYKSGVDTMDQMVGGYTCKRATNRWPLALFYNMLDVAGLAAFVIHDKLGHVKRNDRRRVFLMELAEQLVIPHMEERGANPIVRGMQHVKQAMELFGVEVAAGPPIDDQPAHAASSSTRPSCWKCYKLEKKQRKTRFHCMYCKKPICQQHSHARYACLECRV